MFAFLFLVAAILVYWLCLDGWPMWACGLYAAFIGTVFALLERADVGAVTSIGLTMFNL